MRNILDRMRLERRITLILLIVALAIMLVLDVFTVSERYYSEETVIEDADSRMSSPDSPAPRLDNAAPTPGSAVAP